MKSIWLILAVVLLTACTPQKPPRVLTEEQNKVLSEMNTEQEYYVKDCYLSREYYSFTMCLESKEKTYHPTPKVGSSGISLGSAAVGYAAGAIIHGGKK